jgi:hypothetical protein
MKGRGIKRDPDYTSGGNSVRFVCSKDCGCHFTMTRRTRGGGTKVYMVKGRGTNPHVLEHTVDCNSKPVLNAKQISMLPKIRDAAASGARLSIKAVEEILASYNALEGNSSEAARVQRYVRAANIAAEEAGQGSNTQWGKAPGFFSEFQRKNPECKTKIVFDDNGRCTRAYAMCDAPSELLLETASLEITGADGAAMKGGSPDDGTILILQCKTADGRIWPLAVGA